MRVRSHFVLCLVAVAVLSQCEIVEYPYYLYLKDLKPVFITIVDQSGSMSSYQTGVRNLIAESRAFILEDLYDGDEEVLDERYFIATWPDGENWIDAFTSEPSTLLSDTSRLIDANPFVSDMSSEEYAKLLERLDAYPHRFYLFYGNGAGAQDQTSRSLQVDQIDSFLEGVYQQLMFFRALLVMAPDGDVNYTDWAHCVIDGKAYTSSSSSEIVPGLFPPMSIYGWYFRSHDPSTMETKPFVKDIIDIALGRATSD